MVQVVQAQDIKFNYGTLRRFMPFPPNQIIDRHKLVTLVQSSIWYEFCLYQLQQLT